MNEQQRTAALNSLNQKEALALLYDWRFWARESQLAPAGDWLVWLLLAGRGFGKTRCGAEWIRERVESGQARRIALVAKTPADVRDVMVEGESGILTISPPWNRPVYEPSKRSLTWPNGAQALAFSAYEPDQLRGPQFDTALCDELASFKYPQETWDNLMFGLRLGAPRCVVMTTPKPIKLLQDILKEPTTVITRGSSYENRVNLAPTFYQQIIAKYEGTRTGRQEIYAEILDEAEGALWKRAWLDAHRAKSAPDLKRIVVAIDPAASNTMESAETGIVAAGMRNHGEWYVLADASGRYSPDGWAKAALRLYDNLHADRIIAEANNGGDMVEHTIRTVRPSAPVKLVHASKGKAARAEPIAALYEQGKVRHVGMFPELEDQLCVASDTLITTRRGQVFICDLTTSDKVLTRQGWYPIKWVGPTGYKTILQIETVCGKIVSVTEGHPVFANGLFRPAEALSPQMEIMIWEPPSSASMLNSRASSISSNPMATIEPAEARGDNCYTVPFGSIITGQFQTAQEFTTLTMTKRTTPLKTSPFFRIGSIDNIITRRNPGVSPHGIPSAGVPMVDRYGRGGRLRRSRVLNAGAPFNQQGCAPNSVLEGVGVSSIKSVMRGKARLVWNLSVDGPPEFFANGVLVHNCTWEPLEGDRSPDRLDALVWALTELVGTGAGIGFFTGQLKARE